MIVLYMASYVEFVSGIFPPSTSVFLPPKARDMEGQANQDGCIRDGVGGIMIDGMGGGWEVLIDLEEAAL